MLVLDPSTLELGLRNHSVSLSDRLCVWSYLSLNMSYFLLFFSPYGCLTGGSIHFVHSFILFFLSTLIKLQLCESLMTCQPFVFFFLLLNYKNFLIPLICVPMGDLRVCEALWVESCTFFYMSTLYFLICTCILKMIVVVYFIFVTFMCILLHNCTYSVQCSC